MEWLFILGLFVLPVGAAAVGVWLKPNSRSWAQLALSPIPLVLALRLTYIVLFTENADPSTAELVTPIVLLVASFIYMWVTAYQKDPELTVNVTAAAGYAAMGAAAARKYQEKRDEERAKALADELDRRADSGHLEI